jgi:hypothetical protein
MFHFVAYKGLLAFSPLGHKITINVPLFKKLRDITKLLFKSKAFFFW